ncbi:hypothetical protein MY9_3648 [Bacillus sp. JS]|nr:hypothetical protein MY9_3648 [Bacillus sp. JS]
MHIKFKQQAVTIRTEGYQKKNESAFLLIFKKRDKV